MRLAGARKAAGPDFVPVIPPWLIARSHLRIVAAAAIPAGTPRASAWTRRPSLCGAGAALAPAPCV